MCRFTVYAGEPASLDRLVFGGSHPLVEQAWAPRELRVGSVNADGYAVAWYPDERPVRIARAEPVWYDPDLKGVLESISSPLGIASIRNATPGIPLGPTGVTPMLHDRWAFVLNGYVQSFRSRFMRRFHDELSDEVYAALGSASDSEALFLLAVEALRKGAAPGEALLRVVDFARDAVRQEGMAAQLNMVLSDGERVAVTRTSSVAETNSLYVGRGGPLAPGGVLVASEALDDDETWSRVDPHTLVTADLEGGVGRTPIPAPGSP